MNTWHLGVHSSCLWKAQAVSSFHTCPCTQAPQPALLTVFLWDPAVKDMLVTSLLWFHQRIVCVTLSDWPTPVLHAQWCSEEERGPASEGSGTRHTREDPLSLWSALFPYTSRYISSVLCFPFWQSTQNAQGWLGTGMCQNLFPILKDQKEIFFLAFIKPEGVAFSCVL